jgi:hypothetical protein
MFNNDDKTDNDKTVNSDKIVNNKKCRKEYQEIFKDKINHLFTKINIVNENINELSMTSKMIDDKIFSIEKENEELIKNFAILQAMKIQYLNLVEEKDQLEEKIANGPAKINELYEKQNAIIEKIKEFSI